MTCGRRSLKRQANSTSLFGQNAVSPLHFSCSGRYHLTTRREIAPTAEARNIARAGNGFRLDQKPFRAAVAFERERADRERRWHVRDKAPEGLGRHGP